MQWQIWVRCCLGNSGWLKEPCVKWRCLCRSLMGRSNLGGTQCSRLTGVTLNYPQEKYAHCDLARSTHFQNHWLVLFVIWHIHIASLGLMWRYNVPLCKYRVGQKSKLLIFSEYVNKTEKIGGTWTNTNNYKENEALSDIFTWNILHHNRCFMFKYSMTVLITQRSIRPLRKHDVIKVYSMEYLTTQIELVSPTFYQLLGRSQNYRIFNVRTIVLAFEISIIVQQVTFLTHPVESVHKILKKVIKINLKKLTFIIYFFIFSKQTNLTELIRIT